MANSLYDVRTGVQSILAEVHSALAAGLKQHAPRSKLRADCLGKVFMAPGSLSAEDAAAELACGLRVLAEHFTGQSDALGVLQDLEQHVLDSLNAATSRHSYLLYKWGQQGRKPEAAANTLITHPSLLRDYVYFSLNIQSQQADNEALWTFLADPTSNGFFPGKDLADARRHLFRSLGSSRRTAHGAGLANAFLTGCLRGPYWMDVGDEDVKLSVDLGAKRSLIEELGFLQRKHLLCRHALPLDPASPLSPVLRYVAMQGRVLDELELATFMTEPAGGSPDAQLVQYLAILDYLLMHPAPLAHDISTWAVRVLRRGLPARESLLEPDAGHLLDACMGPELLLNLCVLLHRSPNGLAVLGCTREAAFFAARRCSWLLDDPAPLVEFMRCPNNPDDLLDRAWQFAKLAFPMSHQNVGKWLGSPRHDASLERLLRACSELFYDSRIVPYMHEAITDDVTANALLPSMAAGRALTVDSKRAIRAGFALLSSFASRLVVLESLIGDSRASQSTLEASLAELLRLFGQIPRCEANLSLRLSMCRLLKRLVELQLVSPLVLWAACFKGLELDEWVQREIAAVMPTLHMIPLVEEGDCCELQPEVQAIMDALSAHVSSSPWAFAAITLACPMDIIKRRYVSALSAQSLDHYLEHNDPHTHDVLVAALAKTAGYEVESVMPRPMLLGTSERPKVPASLPAAIFNAPKPTSFTWFTAGLVFKKSAVSFPPLLSLPFELRGLLLDKVIVHYLSGDLEKLQPLEIELTSADCILTFGAQVLATSSIEPRRTSRLRPSKLLEQAVAKLRALVPARGNEEELAAIGLVLSRLAPSDDHAALITSPQDILDQTVARHFRRLAIDEDAASSDAIDSLSPTLANVGRISRHGIGHVHVLGQDSIDRLFARFPELAYRQSKYAQWIDALVLVWRNRSFYHPADAESDGKGDAPSEPSHRRIPDEYAVRLLLGRVHDSLVCLRALAGMRLLPRLDWSSFDFASQPKPDVTAVLMHLLAMHQGEASPSLLRQARAHLLSIETYGPDEMGLYLAYLSRVESIDLGFCAKMLGGYCGQWPWLASRFWELQASRPDASACFGLCTRAMLETLERDGRGWACLGELAHGQDLPQEIRLAGLLMERPMPIYEIELAAASLQNKADPRVLSDLFSDCLSARRTKGVELHDILTLLCKVNLPSVARNLLSIFGPHPRGQLGDAASISGAGTARERRFFGAWLTVACAEEGGDPKASSARRVQELVDRICREP